MIPRLYGTMRLGRNIIWATDFREEQFCQTQGGGKGGGPKVVTEGYLYYASFAVAPCEGPIGGVCRIWADGKPFDVPGAVIRVHLGTESQMPDPFIEAMERLVRAVNLIPSAGEFVYATETVWRKSAPRSPMVPESPGSSARKTCGTGGASRTSTARAA